MFDLNRGLTTIMKGIWHAVEGLVYRPDLKLHERVVQVIGLNIVTVTRHPNKRRGRNRVLINYWFRPNHKFLDVKLRATVGMAYAHKQLLAYEQTKEGTYLK